MSKEILLELKRSELLNKSRSSEKGRQRYNRRNKSSVMKSTKEMNDIDMNSLFKDGILTVCLQVHGETSDYIVKIKFGDFLNRLHRILGSDGNFDIRNITRALIDCFNSENTYIHCSCPDFKFTFSYWASRNDFDAGPEQHDNGKWIRNPNDKLGSSCKHVLLVLSNNRWIQTVARVIFNYVEYIRNHRENLYAKIIYPAIYQQKYEEPTQQNIFDDDSLDKDMIQAANDERRTSTQFKKGNQSGIQFAKEDDVDKNQITLFGDTEDDIEEDNN